MSTTSELKARLARLGPVRDVSRPELTPDESVVVVLRRTGALDKPVTVAKTLFAEGLTLPQSHTAINELAADGRTVCAVSRHTDLARLAAELAEMNVELRRRLASQPVSIDIAALRGRLGLSRRECADLLSLDIAILERWEDGKERPDSAALTLMRLFAQAPAFVEDALTEPVAH
jgi:DNA-binding transcriptional regulator YiaG